MALKTTYNHEPGTCQYCDASRREVDNALAESLDGLVEMLEEDMYPLDIPMGKCPTKPDILPSILQEAQALVHGARNESYGMPWEDYERTVALFKTMIGDKKIADMSATDGMMFMVCVKLSRQAHSHKRDNLVDACGYLECINWSLQQISPDNKADQGVS